MQGLVEAGRFKRVIIIQSETMSPVQSAHLQIAKFQILRGKLTSCKGTIANYPCEPIPVSQTVLARIPQNRRGWMFCGVSARNNVEWQNGHRQSILIKQGVVYRSLNESRSIGIPSSLTTNCSSVCWDISWIFDHDWTTNNTNIFIDAQCSSAWRWGLKLT